MKKSDLFEAFDLFDVRDFAKVFNISMYMYVCIILIEFPLAEIKEKMDIFILNSIIPE